MNQQLIKPMILMFLCAFIIIYHAFSGSNAIADPQEKKWKDFPAITLRLADNKSTVTLGVGDLEIYHNGGLGIGPGVALGYRAVQIALKYLYPGEIPSRGDQFIVSGSAKDCPADAVTYLTGVRYGKGSEGAFNGNLVFDQSIGTFGFIFTRMSNGKAVKLVSRFTFPQEWLALQSRGKTDPEAKQKSREMTNKLVRGILTAPADQIFEVVPLEGFPWKKYKETNLK